MQHALDLARPYAPLILALVVWPIVGAALSWWLWWDTPEHWEAYAKAHPGEHADGCRACAADALAGDPTPTRPLRSVPPPPTYLDARRALSKQPPEQGDAS